MSAQGEYPGLLRLLWETATGRRSVERSGPLLQFFIDMPAPVRDAVRWLLRPQRRFLLGRLQAQSRHCVLSGPFAGMRLAGLPTAPELLGCYERELHATIRTLTQRPFDRIVNVGARYGYYAIGLARLLPRVPVHAFESDAEARRVLEAAIAANDVSGRVSVGGYCDTADLAAALRDASGALVICDIDGGERHLLDLTAVPALAQATILVECHGPVESATEPVMAMRFLPTHDVVRIATEARAASDVPPGVGEPWRSRLPKAFAALLEEHRIPPQSWLLLTPRA